MKTRDILIGLAIVVVLILVIRYILKSFKEGAQDTISQTPFGWAGGIRSVAASDSIVKLDNMDFLTNGFCVRANNKYNNAAYQIPVYLDTSEATRIANEIIDSNSLIPGGFFDESNRALRAIKLIKNQVEAGQVTMAYYNSVGKDLNKGIQWMSDKSIIDATNHFRSLKTGVWQHNKQLTELNA